MNDTMQVKIPFTEESKNGTKKQDVYESILEAIRQGIKDKNMSVDISHEPLFKGFWRRRRIGKRIECKISITIIEQI